MIVFSRRRRFDIADDVIVRAYPTFGAHAEPSLGLQVNDVTRVACDGVIEMPEPVPGYEHVGWPDVPFRLLFAGRVIGAGDPPTADSFAVVVRGQRTEIPVDVISECVRWTGSGELAIRVRDVGRVRVDGRAPPDRGDPWLRWPDVPFVDLVQDRVLDARGGA